MPLNKKILFTGGTGFFGKALLQFWKEAQENRCCDFSVTVLTRNPDIFLRNNKKFSGLPWLDFVQADIADVSSLPAGRCFSHILHAATDSTLGPNIPPLVRYEQIVDGTKNILNFAVKCKAERFLLTSSGGVYGPQPTSMINIPEDWNGMPDPLDPANVYSVAKRMAEHLCVLYSAQYSIECVIARCFAFVGPDLPLNAHFAIGNFIRDALYSPEIIINGDGTPVRSYLDQKDLAVWLDTLLLKGRAGAAYNVGSDQGICLYDLALMVRNLVSPEKKVLRMSQVDPNKNVRNLYLPDITRAKNELGLMVNFSLEESIVNAVSILRNQSNVH